MLFSYFFLFFVIILAVLDLLNNIKVQTVIGPETYLDAKLLAPVADKAKVPIFTLAGSPSMDYPYLFQIKEDESVMAETIATFVKLPSGRMLYSYMRTLILAGISYHISSNLSKTKASVSFIEMMFLPWLQMMRLLKSCKRS